AGVLRAALLGMALPVCAVGVLPVLRELRRLGLPAGKLAAVALAAPLLNPLTVFFGLSVLSPGQTLLLVAATGLACLTAGDVAARFFVPHQAKADTRPVALTGGTRLRNLWIAAGRVVSGQTPADLAMVIAATAVVAAVLPSDAFFVICQADNAYGPAAASLLSLPQYVGPSRGVVQFAGIENANLSTATGLAMYVFGTALSAAGLVEFSRWWGVRRVAALILALLLVVMAASYGAFAVLPTPVAQAGETAVLDGMTRPESAILAELPQAVRQALSLADPLALAGAVGVVVLFLSGVFGRVAKLAYRSDDPAEFAQRSQGRLSKAMPASQLGAAAVTGVGLLFVLSVYMFYPSPAELLERMDAIRLDTSIAILGGDVELALERAGALDAAAASIPIASAIRGSFPNAVQRQLVRDFRGELRVVRTLLLGGELTEARRTSARLFLLQSEAKQAFAGGTP
ncbi:MAG: permease, partial [Planctomycetota bacterium]